MDVCEIRKLIDLMNENDLLELEVEDEGKKVRLRKKAPPEERETTVMMAAPAAGIPVAAPAPAAPAGAPPAAAEPARSETSTTINSPMVGTFYRASGPDTDVFVNVGDEVTPDMVTCIIEAMKVMNEIKAEVSGRITEILVQNGEPVEYGQPIFVVETA